MIRQFRPSTLPVGSPVLPPPLLVRPPVLLPRGAAVDRPTLYVVILGGILYTREDIGYGKGFLEFKKEWGRVVKEKSRGSIDISAKVNNGVDERMTTSSNVTTNTQSLANDTTRVTGVMPSAIDGPILGVFGCGHMGDANVGEAGDVVCSWSLLELLVRNTWGKYGLVKSMLNSSTGIFSFQYSFMEGLDAMLKNGPCYARELIEVRADVELKDNIVVAMLKIVKEGFYTCNVRVEYEWKPPRCTSCKVFGHVQDECPKNKGSDVVKNIKKPSQTNKGVPVGPKVGFKPSKQVYRQVSGFLRDQRAAVDKVARNVCGRTGRKFPRQWALAGLMEGAVYDLVAAFVLMERWWWWWWWRWCLVVKDVRGGGWWW
ncbi:serine/threonine-protein kinase HT1-like protein [Tanacetum coccineum]|uniref:Serine/threonine-protein kinase HT1-like protein n=1 Tax=Tanacetum coccineum TaxID=301880 RepID=A0ABQ4WYP7_9ASTR